jgi:hypothetical protein
MWYVENLFRSEVKILEKNARQPGPIVYSARVRVVKKGGGNFNTLLF